MTCVSTSAFDGAAHEWDTFVRRTEGSTHAHLYGWRALMEEVFGHECLYLAARDSSGELAGVLPLVRVNSLLFGHYLVSMPFLNSGGPIGETDAVRRLAAAAVECARTSGAKLLELRSRTELPLDLEASHRKVTVLLDLPAGGDPDLLWRALPSKLRSQVRRPQKDGIEVRFGADQVEPFFEVFSHHMRDLGTPTQPRRMFERIAATFPSIVSFGCAYSHSRPVAAGCGFSWNGEFEMMWASSLREFSRSAPNMLLYWAFLEQTVRERLAVFNFGRCSPGGRTHHFKQQWGQTRDIPLWWYQASRGRARATPAPDRGAYALGPLVWRRLPLALATALGPRIVRFLP